MYRFSGRFVKDPQIAENIVQDVFVKLWVSREKINITTNVRSYLFTAVKNYSLNHIKQARKISSLEDKFEIIEDKTGTPDEDIIKGELNRAVQKAINELPEQCRRIYLMKKYDDLSYKEIASILGISINTVKTQMKRAFKTLSTKLDYLRAIIICYLLNR